LFTVAIFGFIFGSFSGVWQKNDQNEMKNDVKNGYSEYSETQTSGRWSKNAFYLPPVLGTFKLHLKWLNENFQWAGDCKGTVRWTSMNPYKPPWPLTTYEYLWTCTILFEHCQTSSTVAECLQLCRLTSNGIKHLLMTVNNLAAT
jgi:hypothetical protein